MKKILNIGSIKIGQIKSPVFLKAELEDGKFSISGVIGPLKSGNARGSCGQIKDTIREAIEAGEFTPEAPWNMFMVDSLLETWDEYHLNDMEPACKHQIELGWKEEAKEKVKITEWRLMGSASSQQKEIEEEKLKDLKTTGEAKAGYNEKEILNLEYSLETYGEELPDFSIKQYYTRSKTEEKTRGWINFKDSPLGILCKPCPVCSYEYGSAWNKRELPESVGLLLNSWPESKRVPAWV